MPSTYTDRLHVELMANGENSATWGTKANVVFDLFDEAIAGVVSLAMADGNVTLTNTDGVTNEARNMVLVTTGVNTAIRDLIIPAEEKMYLVNNKTTGGYGIRVLVSGQTAASINASGTAVVYCDGTVTYLVGQQLDTELTALAGATAAADTFPYFTSTTAATTASITSAARSVLDDTSVGAIATTLGLGTGDSPQLTAINLGHATDTTIARSGAGDITIEGNAVYRASGTDVAIADGGTGASTAANAATALGVGTGDSPQFTAVNIGHASDTTVSRASAGDLDIEGNIVYRAGGTDVAVADGGTGSSTAAGARTALSAAAISQTGDMACFTFVGTQTNRSWTVILDAKHGMTITEVTTQCVSGTATATTKINTTALGGTANAVSTSEQTQAHSSANVAAAGDNVVVTFSSVSSCVDVYYTLKYTRTLL